jgi:hypothetical protein
MKPVDVKIMLLRKGLNFADMARQLQPEFGIKPRSLEVMLGDLFYERRWYPRLAQKVHSKFGIKLERPKHLLPIRDQLRQAA